MPNHAKHRPRELGIQFGNLPTGTCNAITDVSGVLVGHVTLSTGDGSLVSGQGPIRTGVTAILPHKGNIFEDKVEAAVHVINGFGKSAGLSQIVELGQLETPIILTNTLSVAAALDGIVEHVLRHNPRIGVDTGTVNAVVGECNDGTLNDIRGQHVRPHHVLQAITTALSGEVREGDVGAGKGMICFGFKGGIGTASRALPQLFGSFTVGCLVLTNFGRQEMLTIAGQPVGRELLRRPEVQTGDGSVMIILATDAPLDSRQLGRLARRGGFGLARCGSVASHGSGDFVIAFSTTTRSPHYINGLMRNRLGVHEDGELFTALFQAVVESTEEAVINSLFASHTVVGRDGNTIEALPVEDVLKILRRRNELEQ